MSVQTTATANIDATKEHLDGAIESLSIIVVSRAWGYDDFTDDYRKQLRLTLFKLMELRDTLGE